MPFCFLFSLLFLNMQSTYLQADPAQQVLQEQLNDNEPPQMVIRSHLTETEADEILHFLQQKGIASTKKVKSANYMQPLSALGWEVAVIPSNAAEALLFLQEAGLPKRKRSTLFEAFVNKIRAAYVMTESQQFQAEELEKYIEEQPGIVDAEVLMKWDLNEKNPKVLVYIEHTGSLDDPSCKLGAKIKKLVLQKIAGLTEQNLLVILERVPRKQELKGAQGT